MSIFQGSSLNIDEDPNQTEIWTNRLSLQGNLLTSSQLTRADHQVTNKLSLLNPNIVSASFHNLKTDFFSSKILKPPSIPNCKFELESICLACVKGYLIMTNDPTKCVECLGNYLELDNKCKTNNLTTNSYTSSSQNFYSTGSINKNNRSQDIATKCSAPIFTELISGILMMCSFDMMDSNINKFLHIDIRGYLNTKLIGSDFEIPTQVSYYYSKDLFGNTSFISSVSNDFLISENVVKLTVEGFFKGFEKYNFILNLPNYHPTLTKNDNVLVDIKISKHYSNMNDISGNKNIGTDYYINSVCNSELSTMFVGPLTIQCVVPNSLKMRRQTLQNSDLVLACPKNCLECDNSVCFKCETKFLLTPDNFHCIKCSPDCDKCIDNPGNCVVDYWDLLSKSIFFYDYQRSGFIPDSERRICWRDHTFLKDKSFLGFNLIGGWFDSGGTMKRNYSLSFSVMIIEQGLYHFKSRYQTAQLYEKLIDQVRIPLEYLNNCFIKESEVYIQCGLENEDSLYWGRPEDFKGERDCLALDENMPGSDVAASMASALAFGYLLFKDLDIPFADKVLATARKLLSFANANLGSYIENDQFQNDPYGNSEFYDDLTEANLILYKATNESVFLNTAKGFYDDPNNSLDTITTDLFYNNKRLSVNFLLYEATDDPKYLTVVENYLQTWIESLMSPGGLAQKSSGPTLLHPIFVSAYYMMILDHTHPSKLSILVPSQIQNWVKSQMEYASGKNPFKKSLMIGNSMNYPEKVRHGGSSCPSFPLSCDGSFEFSVISNPNPVNGAFVNGIGRDDQFDDYRLNHVNGVDLVTNAPVSAVYVSLFVVFGTTDNIRLDRIPQTQDCTGKDPEELTIYTNNVDLVTDYYDDKATSPFSNPLGNFVIFFMIHLFDK